MNKNEFQKLFSELTDIKANDYHPLVWIGGEPEFGNNVYIGGMSEVYAKGAKIIIGDNCDIASFVVINCSDSHKKTIGINEEIERRDIIIEDHVYIGTQSFIGGGVHIGHHSVIGAGTIVRAGDYPPYSLIIGNPAICKSGYYFRKKQETINQKNKGEFIRKLKIGQSKPQNIVINNMNNDKMMRSENLKQGFSDNLGGI